VGLAISSGALRTIVWFPNPSDFGHGLCRCFCCPGLFDVFPLRAALSTCLLAKPETAAFCQRSCGRIISTMTLKNAAFFALIWITLLTVLLAASFIRDISGFMGGAVAAVALLTSGIHLLASLSVAVFLYVFHKAQS
jgi:hypothetical protein